MKCFRIRNRPAWLVPALVLVSIPTFSYLLPPFEERLPPLTRPSLLGADPPLASVWVSSRMVKGSESVLPQPKRQSQAPPTGLNGEAPRVKPADSMAFTPALSVGERLYRTEGASLLWLPTQAPLDSVPEGWSEPEDPTVGPDFEGSLESELLGLEQGYETALVTLFGLGGRGFDSLSAAHNPFQEASKSEDSKRGTVAVGDQSSNPYLESAEGGSSAAGQPEVEEEPFTFDFLIMGELEGNEKGRRVFRAIRESGGEFVLENSFRFHFFPHQEPVGFHENEQLVTTDLNGDGLSDFVFARVGPLGTRLDSYVRDSSGSFQRWAYGFLFHKSVRSLAVFDFDGDEHPEILLALFDHPYLVVYRRSGERFEYLQELVLPFTPGLVVDSETGLFAPGRRVYVFDIFLHQVVSLSSQHPGTFLVDSNLPLTYLRGIDVEYSASGAAEKETIVFEHSGRIAVAEKGKSGVSLVGSFDISVDVPLVIVGDYLGRHSRQLIYVP